MKFDIGISSVVEDEGKGDTINMVWAL